MTVDELCTRYSTHATNGMTSAAAEKALEEYGPNELTPPYQLPKWRMFLNQMFGGFATLLWIGMLTYARRVYIVFLCPHTPASAKKKKFPRGMGDGGGAAVSAAFYFHPQRKYCLAGRE